MFNHQSVQKINDLQQFLPQIERLKLKLQALKDFVKDKNDIFAQHHHYEMNEPLSLIEVAELEQNLNVILPNNFKSFLHYFGNGGAGRGYGIFSSDRLVSIMDWYFDNASEKMYIRSKFDNVYRVCRSGSA